MVPRGCPEPQLAAACSDLSPVDPISATTKTGMMKTGREKHESPQPGAEPFLSPRRLSSLLRSSCFVAAARSFCRWRRETRKNTWRVRASQLTPRQLLEESARPSEHHLLRAGGDENKGVGGWWWEWGGGCLPGDRGGLHGISSRKSPLCLC